MIWRLCHYRCDYKLIHLQVFQGKIRQGHSYQVYSNIASNVFQKNNYWMKNIISTCFGSPAKTICDAKSPIGIIDSGSVVSPASSRKPSIGNGYNRLSGFHQRHFTLTPSQFKKHFSLTHSTNELIHLFQHIMDLCGSLSP